MCIIILAFFNKKTCVVSTIKCPVRDRKQKTCYLLPFPYDAKNIENAASRSVNKC
jgi:hypothetical protein